MNKSHTKKFYLAYLIIVFSIFLTIFIKIRPLVIYDLDDWNFCSLDRYAVPLFKNWNPCRILPENLMSWCSVLGVFLIMPFTNDFITSLVIIYGITIAIFITVYIHNFCNFLIEKLQMSLFSVITTSLIFIIFHYLVFQKDSDGNKLQHMFLCRDVTCYFFYAIPNLLNTSLVMYFTVHGFFQENNLLKKSLLILLLYLAIFSNLFQTIIIISFISSIILQDIFQAKKNGNNIKSVLKKELFTVSTIIVWLISILFEYTGGRSESLSNSHSTILETLNIFLVFVKNCTNRAFTLTFFAFVLSSVVLFLKNKKKKRIYETIYFHYMIRFIYCGLITIIFNILLCANGMPNYIKNTEVLFGFVFYMFLIFAVSVYYVIVNYKQILLLFPLIIYILFSITMFRVQFYAVSESFYVNYETCRKIDNYFIKELIYADNQHIENFTLEVPVSSSSYNWPHPKEFGPIISRTLYKYKIIQNNINVEIKINPELNKKFNLNVDGSPNK